MPGMRCALGKHPVPSRPLLWRVIPDAPSPKKQGSACLATSLPCLWVPSHSPKGSLLAMCARARWQQARPRGAFVSRTEPTLSRVCVHVACCGPLPVRKLTSLASPMWESTLSPEFPGLAGSRRSMPLVMLFCR